LRLLPHDVPGGVFGQLRRAEEPHFARPETARQARRELEHAIEKRAGHAVPVVENADGEFDCHWKTVPLTGHLSYQPRCEAAIGLLPPETDHRQVVALRLAAGERPEIGLDGVDDAPGPAVRSTYRLDQALLAVKFLPLVQRFGDTVGVEQHRVAANDF